MRREAAEHVANDTRSGDFRSIKIDGLMFERWLLKTTINVAFEREIQQGKRWTPSQGLVEICFGARAFPEGTGLHLELENEVDYRRTGSYVGLRVLTKGDEIIGGQFRLDEIGFIVSTETLLNDGRTLRRPKLLEDEERSGRRIHFVWAGEPAAA